MTKVQSSQTKVIIKGSVLIKNAPNRVLLILRKELTHDNPKYKQAKKSGYIPDDLSPYVYHFKNMGSSSIIVPKGMLRRVLALLKGSFNPKDIMDYTVAPKIDLEFKGVLRDYQDEAVANVLPKRYGILEAATGAGKTIMGTYMTANRGLRTLIVVHNKELFQQWPQALLNFTNIKEENIGLIGAGKYSIGDVTVAIVNTIAKHADELKNEFGFVIYDECHRAAGNTWVRVINTLRPQASIGLSATPYRSDGLTKVLFQLMGPLLHKVDRKHLENTGSVLVPRVIKVNTQFDYNFNNDYSTMLSKLASDQKRNVLIANTVINEFKRYKEPMMVVSDRVAHCNALFALLNGQAGIRPVVVHGQLKTLSKSDRQAAVQGVRDGKYNMLIATVSLLGEGFDAPDLNAIALCTPIKFSGRLMQVIGRILRPSKGGQPRVYDFRDNLVKTLRYSGFHRNRVYAASNWDEG